MSVSSERAARLQAWLDDIQLSARLGVPQYANPSELKADLRELLAERDSLADRLEAAERERDEAHFAHLALDDFGVPREEPHFHSPYKLAGRIRWLRSKLIIDANQRAGKAARSVLLHPEEEGKD